MVFSAIGSHVVQPLCYFAGCGSRQTCTYWYSSILSLSSFSFLPKRKWKENENLMLLSHNASFRSVQSHRLLFHQSCTNSKRPFKCPRQHILQLWSWQQQYEARHLWKTSRSPNSIVVIFRAECRVHRLARAGLGGVSARAVAASAAARALCVER